MKNQYVKIVCLILFVTTLTVSGKRSRTGFYRPKSFRSKPGSFSTTTSSSTNSSSTTMSSVKSTAGDSKAITELLNLRKKDPTSSIINDRLGWLYYLSGKYSRAEYYYKKSLKYNETNVEARLGLYFTSMAIKDYKKAESYCRQVIKIDKLNYYGNLYLVYAQMAQAKYKHAEMVCKKMLAVYPCDTTFMGLLKSNYTYQKKSKSAQKMQNYLDLLK
ncbi:MAG: tetratricopeptide repeat protein [Victivallaceae bacterium]|nr:tetratricopeptide repeat protein [Victivallaceae bacterium]